MTNTTNRPPQEKVCGYEYTVKRGDSFYLIAHRLGVPLRDLLEANSSINPARLMVGDVLCIPMEEDDAPPQAPSAPSAPPEDDADDSLDQPASPGDDLDEEIFVCPEGNRQTLQEGQSITDIQLSGNLNLHTLQSANPNVDFSTLQAGQVLCVPSENIPCPAVITYTLQTGETLESVALKTDASVAALLRANPCLAPGDFVAGVCIRLPQ